MLQELAWRLLKQWLLHSRTCTQLIAGSFLHIYYENMTWLSFILMRLLYMDFSFSFQVITVVVVINDPVYCKICGSQKELIVSKIKHIVSRIYN